MDFYYTILLLAKSILSTLSKCMLGFVGPILYFLLLTKSILSTPPNKSYTYFLYDKTNLFFIMNNLNALKIFQQSYIFNLKNL